MEYIQNLYYMVQDYWILTMLIGLMSCFVESCVILTYYRIKLL